MILYIIMDAICLQGIDGSRARVVFMRNVLIAGPAQWGMRDQNTCFVWNALTVVFMLAIWSYSSQ